MRGAWRMVRRIVFDFRKNQGVLLSGAVAFHTLLSIVPLFVVLLAVLSRFLDEQYLLDAVRGVLATLVSPDSEAAITVQVRGFLDHRQVVGGVGALVLLFFSSLAFTTLENAMSVIFHHRRDAKHRHFLVSAVIPYVFITSLGVGLLIVSVLGAALRMLGRDAVHIGGATFSLAGLSGFLLYVLGLASLALILTAVYLVMPVGHIRLRNALVGGITATALWEIVRHALVWYFTHLSMVNIVYGSLATAVVALLTLEAAALILLFGAQVIADIDRRGHAEQWDGFHT